MKPREHSEVFARSAYVAAFSIKQVFGDGGAARFDVEMTLADEWRASSPRAAVRFMNVRRVRYGDGHDGIDFGARLCLIVDDGSDAGWEDIGFRAVNVENSCPFSLFCRSFEVLDGREKSGDIE